MASRCDGFSRPHAIDWRKQPVSASVLSARITRLLSQETAQVEDSHPRWFVQPSANCRNLAVASGNSGVVFSTTYEWRLNCHLSDASCDCDEGADAQDHEKGKRGSGL